MTGQFSGTDKGNANLTITDGTTTGFGINKITVSAGDLTSASNGEAVIDTSGGGGGGSGVSSISFDSTGLTPNTVSTGAIVVGGQLNIANGGTGASTASGARTALGLGTIATQDSDSVSITGGTITGIDPLDIDEGGTGASTASGARTALGLGTIATQDSDSVSITGGSIANITDLAIADGGTGASNASGARSNLGLGTIATQNSNAVSITGGSITGINPLAIADGGTEADNSVDALRNLGGLPSIATIETTGAGFAIAPEDAGKIFVMTVGGPGNLAILCDGDPATLFQVGFQCVVLLNTTAGGQVQLTPINGGKLNGSDSLTVNLTTDYQAYTLVIVSQDDGVWNWVAIG